MSTAPTLRLERSLLRGGVARLACADEVGRGSLCGPVSIGMVVVTAETNTAPAGVRDSKLLSERQRNELVPKNESWAAAWAVGHASNDEIDDIGIVGAMRLAGQRALVALAERGCAPDAVLLDGHHDYLSNPDQGLLFGGGGGLVEVPEVTTKIKADMTCAGVAAASILAKTTRDALMVDLARDHPEYGWADNKGYASPQHLEALGRLGASALHRRSWSLPGVSPTGAKVKP